MLSHINKNKVDCENSKGLKAKANHILMRNYLDFEYFLKNNGNLFCEIWVSIEKE